MNADRPDELIDAHVSIEPTAIGPYGAVLTMWKAGTGVERTRYRIPLDDLETLLSNLVTSVMPRNQHRRLNDALAGDCGECSNTRMVSVKKVAGQVMREHCPRCRPLIDAGRARLDHVPDDEAGE